MAEGDKRHYPEKTPAYGARGGASQNRGGFRQVSPYQTSSHQVSSRQTGGFQSEAGQKGHSKPGTTQEGKPGDAKASGKGKGAKTQVKREYKRVGGRMIGALLPPLTKPVFRKKSPLFVRLLMEWDTLVGPELARQSEPCRLRPGVLTIRCCGPAAVEMHYAAPRILANINTACGLYGEEALSHVKLVQDRPVQRDPAPPPRRRKDVPPAPVEGLEDGPLKEALARLGGHILAKRRGAKKSRRF